MTQAKGGPVSRGRTLAWLRGSPTVWAWLLCCVYTGLLVWAITAQTDNHFVYPLDDSYIHLALARTLAVHHVWGMGPAEFGSASSSPGWTLMLAAADLLFGSHLLTPLLLNLVLVFCVLFVVDRSVEVIAPATPRWLRGSAYGVLVLGTPLPNLVLIGMEHVAQTLSVLVLVLIAARILSSDPAAPVPLRQRYLLLGAAAFAGAIRYEAVFAIAPIVVLLLWRRRTLLAVLLAVSAAVGPVAFGLYSHHRSGFWLPFSVIAKAALQGSTLTNLRSRAITLATWRSGVPLLWTLLPLWLLRCRSRSFWDASQLILLLTFVLAVSHLLLAPVGWLMRYESYFVLLTLVALFLAAALTAWPRHPLVYTRALRPWDKALTAVALIGVLWLLPSLMRRMYIGTVTTVRSAVDRYDEHLQMARFVAAFYDRDTIVVDDIGAVAFYAHAHLLDMIGLGSVEPLLAPRHGRPFTVDDMARWAIAKDASIAILQSGQRSIQSLTPGAWTLVETWRMPRNVLFEDYDISLYAIKPGEIDRLCASLRQFQLTPHDRITVDRCPAP